MCDMLELLRFARIYKYLLVLAPLGDVLPCLRPCCIPLTCRPWQRVLAHLPTPFASPA